MKIYPSLLDHDPISKLEFQTKAERNQFVIQKRSEGYTLQAIADSLGLTREMIRLIVKSLEGPCVSEVRQVRIHRQESEIRNAARNLTSPDLKRLAQQFEISTSKVRVLMGTQVKKYPQTHRHFGKYYYDVDLLQNLRDIAQKVEGPLSAKKFIENGGEPTLAVFLTRFGSWINACQLAGVKSGVAARKNYKRAHTDETMLAYMASYLADPRTNGSANGYEKWQRGVEGAPSLSLIRQRMGTWNELKIRLLRDGI